MNHTANCYHCNADLIWQRDFKMIDKTDGHALLLSSLCCSECDAEVLVALPIGYHPPTEEMH